MKKKINNLKKTLQYMAFLIKSTKEYYSDGIDEELLDIIFGAIKEIDEIKKEIK